MGRTLDATSWHGFFSVQTHSNHTSRSFHSVDTFEHARSNFELSQEEVEQLQRSSAFSRKRSELNVLSRWSAWRFFYSLLFFELHFSPRSPQRNLFCEVNQAQILTLPFTFSGPLVESHPRVVNSRNFTS